MIRPDCDFALGLAAFFLSAAPIIAQPMELDAAFAPEVESSISVVETMRFVAARNGELIVLGDGDPGLTHVDDVAVSHGIARLLSNGSVDPSFQAHLPDAADVVRGAVALPDGRVLVTTRSATGLEPARIVRLLQDGRTDPTFPPLALAGGVGNLTLLSDGSVVVWGSFTAIGGVSRNSLARVLPDGAVDTAFAPAITDAALTVVSLVATPTDHIVFSAQGDRQDQPLSFHFNRLTPAGAIDPSFAPPPPDRTFHLIGALSDERLLISRDGLFRLNADGSNDLSYAAQIAPENLLGAVVLNGDRLAATIATPTAADGGVPSVFILGPDGTIELDARELPGAERIHSLRGSAPMGPS